MQKRIMQVASSAVLLASLATPAFAHGNGQGKGNGGGHGWTNARETHGEGEGNGHGKGHEGNQGDEGNHQGDQHEGDHAKQGGTHQPPTASCLLTARQAYLAAIRAANDAYHNAISDARDAYRTANAAAKQARGAARSAARAAYHASAKDDAARAAYAAAKSKANDDWRAARAAADTAFITARQAAQDAFAAAKAKAKGDFSAAKQSCSTTTTADTTAPAAVTDLALSGATSSSIALAWTAPGDDGTTGTAASYDIRYSTTAITDANFASATAVSGEPTPAVAGTSQSMTVTGLSATTTYYFAMKTSDEVPNVSLISNLPSLATTAVVTDTTAPATITTLALSAATQNSLLLTWTAPGDDGTTGTAASYDIRYSTSNIATDADWTAATQASGEPAPAVAGTTQTMTVSGLNPSTAYFFAIKATDEASNVSALSNVPTLATLADTTAPAAITTLSLSAPTASAITLTWTAPGDDGSVGTASSYDVRYSTSTILTDADWNAASPATGEPAPAVAGTTQTMTVSGLTASTTYFFAIRATDNAANVSGISNVPSLATTAL